MDRKNTRRWVLVFIAFLMVCNQEIIAKGKIEGNDNSTGFSEYLKQHQIIYRQPPAGPEDGFPIGNRRLVGMVYMKEGDYKICLAKDDVWDHRSPTYEQSHFGLTHQKVLKLLAAGDTSTLMDPPGDFYKQQWPGQIPKSGAWVPYPAPKVVGWITIDTYSNDFIEQRLFLSKAKVLTKFNCLELEAFVAASRNVLVVRITPHGKQEIQIEFNRPESPDPGMNTKPYTEEIDGYPVLNYPFPTLEESGYPEANYTFPDGPGGFSYSVALELRGEKHRVERREESILFRASTQKPITLLVSVATSIETEDPARSAVQSLKGFDLRAVRKEYDKYWDDFWSKSHIQLSDKFVESIWYFNLYQAGVSYSPLYAGGLSGPFFFYEPSPWQNDLHDVNEPFKYYAVHAANHPELAEGFVETYWRMIPRVRENTQRFYDLEGIRFPHACGYSGDEMEAFPYLPGAFKFQYMQSGPGLVANIAWWHFLYTGDTAALRKRIYPIVKGAAQFYSNYLMRGDDGLYHVYPTFSPEQEPSLWCRDATIDLAAIRFTLKAAIRGSEILGVDSEERGKWKERLEKIAPYPKDEQRILEFEGDKRDYLFGHDSILYCIHPFSEYNPDDSLYTDLFQDTQQRLGLDDGATFAKAHLAVCAAWLGMSQKAWDLLYDICLCRYLKPNGFLTFDCSFRGNWWEKTNLCPPGSKAQIFEDVSAGVVACVNEMLLQSQKGVISVFPALPEKITGAFQDLRARGGFLVSARKDERGIRYLRVKATEDGLVRIKNPWSEERVVVQYANKKKDIISSGQGILEFSVDKGMSLLLFEEGVNPAAAKWPESSPSEPRKKIRDVKEKLPPGNRNGPIKEPAKTAEICILWLGKPAP